MSQAVATGKPFSWRIRVYWEDTDAGGVVYHAGYLRFLERARTEWLRSLGVDQVELRQRTGLAFMVRDMHIDFLGPAVLDDEVDVSVCIQSQRSASMVFEQIVRRVSDGRELIRATVRAACVNLQAMRPAAIPDDLIARMS
ncbi:tol-pal system-associated acyl-CoA thioesterase [Oleiagrimonas sp. C23AA]|uniref:tol-pal system-associated acyl-CoA thioesterase n=1 Tax=Oleiagrimonas sp. C23AA TaxID=2719047 RepID=UPI00141F94B3|nr:tol-pal system-associated acyl-CoA thioesterase [Oleiagrimonas sp. C23AA]NII09972.1 tol-pal system-associated acyl-CoA thioesterase [Oleiagrimonas sp. C23AA]